MRLATFNILHGRRVVGPGPGSEGDAEGLARAIDTLQADVLALQEVDVGQPRSGVVDQSCVAADVIGAGPSDRRFVPAVTGTPGDRRTFADPGPVKRRRIAEEGPGPGEPMYGVALASRLPTEGWRHTAFTAPRVSMPLLVPTVPKPRLISVPDEPRVVIATTVSVAGRQVTVATAHLSFVPGVNVAQLRRIVRWLENFPRPLVLMGDFNLPGRIPEIVTGWKGVVGAPTYPSFGPRVRFDHVLMDGWAPGAVDAARRSAVAHVLEVSDHCAVTVDLPDL